jgi:hypothetical protein
MVVGVMAALLLEEMAETEQSILEAAVVAERVTEVVTLVAMVALA